MQTTPHLTVPLTAIAHDWARQFAVEQANPQKGKQIYLNTLAVWAVYRYLNWLQVDTDLERSDSWNPRLNALLDIADLVLPAVGRLECRPVLPHETEVVLPPEARDDRIGYVAVQLDESLIEGQLLGFISSRAIADDTETFSVAALQSLDQLVEVVGDLKSNALAPQSGQETVTSLTHLGHWLQHQFGIGWQSVEALLGNRTSGLAFRGVAVRRAKRLEFQHPEDFTRLQSPSPETEPISQRDRLASLAFVVSLKPESPEQIYIHLQICNLGEWAELPPHLRLRVLTETGEVFREIKTQEQDTFMQYEFTGRPGEQFSVEITLEDAYIRETFMI